MLFNSYTFILLVLGTLALFYLPLLRPFQSLVLIAASFVFYAYGQPALLALLIFSILINFTTSYRVIRATRPAARKRWAVAGVATNLAVLLLFKYGPLAARTAGLDATDPGSLGHFLVSLPLPIGISFFTFQGISLLVDVYRQKEGSASAIAAPDAWRHFVHTALFKAFFPQLVAGPIVKAHDFFPQIRPKYLHAVAWEAALRSLILGYFLKMVVADNLKDLTFWMTFPYFTGMSTATLVTMLFGYSMQIFADFAGYSLIAIGTARLFGYELMQNFNFPYIAQSLSEFWRRWHISLSTWLKEYVYFPLGGNRHGGLRTYFNLLAVMVLGGLWHGAAWSYAIWGLWHGVGLMLERALGAGRTPVPGRFSIVRALLVFGFVTTAWLLFRLPDSAHALAYLRACVTNLAFADDTALIAYILFYSAPVIAWHALHLARQRSGFTPGPRWQSLAYGACVAALLVNSGSPGAFIYFQF